MIKNRKFHTVRPRARLIGAAAACLCASLIAAGCAKPEVEGEGAPVDESVEAALPQGGDYQSTAIRARGRALSTLQKADDVRSEQLEDAGLSR